MTKMIIPPSQIIPKEILGEILEFAQLCNADGTNVWVVGGAIRDAILCRPIKDIDLVVDSDALNLTSKLKVPFKSFPQFSTIKAEINEFTVDLATMRSEHYMSPGALPKTWPSDILADLSRRDFAMNSIAVSLNHGSEGEVLDPNNGLEDIQKSTIRVLHTGSFRDDATRILRAIRYSVGLGFKLSSKTKKAFTQDSVFLNTISPARIRRELILITNEPLGASILLKAHRLGLLSKIINFLDYGELDSALLNARRLKLSGQPLFYLLLCQINLNTPSTRLALTKNEKLTAQKLQTALQNFTLTKVNRFPSKVRNELKDFTDKEIRILFEISNQKTRNNISLYLSNTHRMPLLTFEDLKIMGFPENHRLKIVMGLLSDQVIDGHIRNKRSEVIFVKKLKLEGLDR